MAECTSSPAPQPSATLEEPHVEISLERDFARYYLQESYSSSSTPSSNKDELEQAITHFNELEHYSYHGHGEQSGEFADLHSRSFIANNTDLENLFKRVATNHYKAVVDDEEDMIIFANCMALFKKDYEVELLQNEGGTLSWNYPCRIIIPVADKFEEAYSNTPFFDRINDPFFYDKYPCDPAPFIATKEKFEEFCEFSKKASIARCRNRFPVPVIYYKGKFICRSATLAVRKGVAFGLMTKREPHVAIPYENPFQYVFDGISNIAQKGASLATRIRKTFNALLTLSMDDVKDMDLKILTSLGIDIICDLMVEDRKMHTGMSVGSSEKVNLNIFGKFKMLALPYPGCSFFKKYSTRQRSGFGLYYDWKSKEVTRNLGLINDIPSATEIYAFEGVKWSQYKEWDLIDLTKNIVRALLHFFAQSQKTLLVHCISGWDRTPLFISLVRMSLWADGLIHQNLNTVEMAYFTLAYDWYLFGHNLPTRISRREEIMHFCFNFLTELIPNHFTMRYRPNTGARCDHFIERGQKLLALQEVIMPLYDKYIKI